MLLIHAHQCIMPAQGITLHALLYIHIYTYCLLTILTNVNTWDVVCVGVKCELAV